MHPAPESLWWLPWIPIVVAVIMIILAHLSRHTPYEPPPKPEPRPPKPQTIQELQNLHRFDFQDWVIKEMNAETFYKRKGSHRYGQLDGYILKDEFREASGIQVEQSEGVGRDVVDSLKIALRGEKYKIGYLVAFSFGEEIKKEVARLKNSGDVHIELVTVEDLLSKKVKFIMPEPEPDPQTIQELKNLHHSKFQDWVINEMNAKPSERKVGDMGLDGYILKDLLREASGIQVKQSEGVGRNVVDNFKAALDRAKYKKGYIVAFSFGEGSKKEVARLKNSGDVEIELVTVKDLLSKKVVLERHDSPEQANL